MLRKYILYGLFGFSIIIAGCDTTDSGGGGNQKKVQAVYTQTNAAGSNQVIAYKRADDGSLSPLGTFDTKGKGSGKLANIKFDPLGSQDAIIINQKTKNLYVVDAGSNEISSFSIQDDGTLTFINKVSSGGKFPLSLTIHGNLLYVLNAKANGGRGNISGFTVGDDGSLSPLSGSSQPLSGVDTPLPNHYVAPAEVQFNRDGNFLFVTEKATSLIDVYSVGSDGTPSAPKTQKSVGRTPFGTAFDANGHFIVSEANTTAPRKPVPDSSSMSTYSVAGDGTLNPITSSLITKQTAACWVAVTNDNNYVYETNTAVGTITGFKLGADGSLTNLNPTDGNTADTGPKSITLGLAVSDNYIYVLSAGTGKIQGFKINGDGSLTKLSNATGSGFPNASVDGIAATNY